MDERQLVKDCLKGKPEAQRALYELYAKNMLGVCYRYTKSLNDAEDVLQEGFVKVFLNMNQYRSQGELGGWIRRIMVNTALNFLKKNRRYREEMVFTEQPLHPVTDENPDIELNAKELANLVRQLPQGYQTVFNMYAIEVNLELLNKLANVIVFFAAVTTITFPGSASFSPDWK